MAFKLRVIVLTHHDQLDDELNCCCEIAFPNFPSNTIYYAVELILEYHGSPR
jgi:hypothetical protein